MVPSTEPVPIAAGSLVVLVGPVASGKSTWAAEQVAASSIVSSDALRALVGEGEHDLRASADAFALLERIVTLRAKRRLTTVIDTLGLDAGQRETWRRIARAAGVPAIAAVFDTPASECRRRNAERDLPVPADVVRAQLTRWPEVVATVAGEPWDQVLTAVPVAVVPPALAPRRQPAGAPGGSTLDPALDPALDSTLAPTSTGSTMRIGLQLSSFMWPGGPAATAERLGDIAARAEAAGVAHLWVMDHLRQIPQVGPAWNDLPDPFTVLAWLAARTRRVGLGVLVSPAFLRPLATVAKAYATLDVLSGGRAVCGLGVGWFEQEYRAAGVPFPSLDDRYAAIEDALEALPLLWGKGAPPFHGRRISMPEALSYPRPLQPHLPIWVGGSGERRTLPLVARLADGCNLFGEPEAVARKVAILRRLSIAAGREPASITVSQLSTMVVGRSRSETADLVERLRPKRVTAERFANHTNAGTIDQHLDRIARFAEAGVDTVIVSLADVAEVEAIDRLGELIARLPELTTRAR